MSHIIKEKLDDLIIHVETNDITNNVNFLANIKKIFKEACKESPSTSIAFHCVKIVQIRSFSNPYFAAFGLNIQIYCTCSPNTGKYGPEKTPYLDTFYAVFSSIINLKNKSNIAKNLTV